MSKIKVSKTASAATSEVTSKKEWPVVIYLWILGLAVLGYLFGRVGLDALPHPYHWLSGLVGGLTGVPIGWIWYRWRGDVL